MRFPRVVLLALMLSIISTAFSQLTEIECIIIKKNGDYVTAKPAHYDQLALPKVGDKVTLSLYLKDDLSMGQTAKYYDLSYVLITKLIPDLKAIVFKMEDNIAFAKEKYGISNISIDVNGRIKISWNSFQ